jgi:hypothetical protein
LLLRHANRRTAPVRSSARLSAGDGGLASRRHQALGLGEVTMAGLIHLVGIVGAQR